jgi:glucuronate isomerase
LSEQFLAEPRPTAPTVTNGSDGFDGTPRGPHATPGGYDTVGFDDDTRAFCSIRARHDLADAQALAGALAGALAYDLARTTDKFDRPERA